MFRLLVLAFYINGIGKFFGDIKSDVVFDGAVARIGDKSLAHQHRVSTSDF